jgi:site-specific DNA-methyltransferase (adenine-specific)
MQQYRYTAARVKPDIVVRLGAFPDILADVAPETASLVVADPPWNDLAAWTALGMFCARVLKPHGILVAYIGNRWCFEAIDLLSANLTRVRLAFLPALHESPWDPKVNCHEFGSFMVIMAKGSFDPPGPWSNMVEGKVEGHRWHPFQRPLENVKHYVEAFSKPGELVIDPFLGSGTTAVACAELGRQFLGCDIAPEYVQAAIKRLESPGGTTGDVERT